MFCSECGHELPENARFCPDCGSKTELNDEVALPESEVDAPKVEESAPLEEKKLTNKDIFAIVGFILSLISTCCCCFVLSVFSAPMTVSGVFFSAIGLRSSKKVFAIIGLVLSIIAIILSVFVTIFLLTGGIELFYDALPYIYYE